VPQHSGNCQWLGRQRERVNIICRARIRRIRAYVARPRHYSGSSASCHRLHQDGEQHWVADLECGHTQHVGHDHMTSARNGVTSLVINSEMVHMIHFRSSNDTQPLTDDCFERESIAAIHKIISHPMETMMPHIIKSVRLTAFVMLAVCAIVRPAGAQSGACADSSGMRTAILAHNRHLSWFPRDSTLRRLVSLLTLPDSATADTALTLVTDTTICRQAVTHFIANSAAPPPFPAHVSVIRYGSSHYIVSDVDVVNAEFIPSRVFDLSWTYKDGMAQ
jgi:hypothetical protein